MADYKTQLKNLRDAEKRAAITDLQNTRNQTLSDLEAEQSKLGSTYNAQRTQTSNASKVNARNFQEYLANTGRANSGIGAQYEMGRQNSLNRDLNALNTQQAADMADIERRRTLANNAYNTGLAGANAQVEANYIKNLLDQQQQQFENNLALRQLNATLASRSSSGGGSSGGNPGKKGNGKDDTPTFTDTKISDAALAAEAEINKAFNNKIAGKLSVTPKVAISYINKLYDNGKGSINADDVRYLVKKFNLG